MREIGHACAYIHLGANFCSQHVHCDCARFNVYVRVCVFTRRGRQYLVAKIILNLKAFDFASPSFLKDKRRISLQEHLQILPSGSANGLFASSHALFAMAKIQTRS